MTRPFTGFIMLEAVIIGAWAGWAAVRQRKLGPGQVIGLAVLQVLLMVHGALAAVALAGGREAAEPGTFAVYLGASIVVLPLLIGVPVSSGGALKPLDISTYAGGISIGPPGPRPEGEVDPWRTALVALGCLSVAVILSRMWVTWQHG